MPTHERAGVVAEDGQHRHLHALALFERLAEHRRLGDREPHVQADDHERRAREKRNAPAEREELLVGRATSRAAGRCRRRTESRPARRAAGTCRTRRACPGGAFSTASSTAPPHSPPRPESLPEAAERQQQRRRDANRCVRRQQADRDRRQPHRQQRRDERRLAADAIAEVTEQCRRRSAARETRSRTSPATPASPSSDPICGKNSRGNTSTAAVA